MHQVIVFLSTPRCGTQWLAKNLCDFYSDEAIVLHEPILYDYYPRLNLGRYNSSMRPEDNPKLAGHFDFIEMTTQNKKYIGIGWQSIAGIPELYRRFGDRLKLIHLYRNPIYVAASLVTMDFYTGKIKDRFEKAELNPFDDVSLLTSYKDKWNNLNLFEKSLYYWTEINLRALEIKYRYQNISFYSLQFEDLFKKDKELSRITLIEVLSFIGLEYNKKMLDSLEIIHDEYHNKTNLKIDWRDIEKHPQTLVLANKLGYSFDNKINLHRYMRKKHSLARKIVSKIPPKVKDVVKKNNAYNE